MNELVLEICRLPSRACLIKTVMIPVHAYKWPTLCVLFSHSIPFGVCYGNPGFQARSGVGDTTKAWLNLTPVSTFQGSQYSSDSIMKQTIQWCSQFPHTHLESLRMRDLSVEMCCTLWSWQKCLDVGSADTPSLALRRRCTSTATLWKRVEPWLITLRSLRLCLSGAGGERPRLLYPIASWSFSIWDTFASSSLWSLCNRFSCARNSWSLLANSSSRWAILIFRGSTDSQTGDSFILEARHVSSSRGALIEPFPMIREWLGTIERPLGF